MLLTEECAQAQVPRSPAERQKFIAAQEKAWMSLSWDRKRYTSDQAKTAITLLSAIGFSDFRDPIDLSHLSDEAASSSLDGRSSGDGVSLPHPDSPSTNSQAPHHHHPQSNKSHHHHHGPTTTGENRRRLTGNKRPASDSNMNTSSNTNNNAGVTSSNNNANNHHHHHTHHQSSNNTTNNNINSNNHNNNNNSNNNNSINKPPKKPRRPKQPTPTSITNNNSNATASIPRGTQVACCDKSSPDTSDMWVLGRFDQYIPEIKKYEVLDYDGGEQRYRVTRHNLRVIPKRPPNFDMSKPVLAVYPKTTVFYKARLVARRGKNNWAVEFDDEDDYDSDKIKEIDGRLILQDVSLS